MVGHYYCEDSWYSCPLAEGGCADDQQEAGKCNCGYEERINKIAAALLEEIEHDAKVADESYTCDTGCRHLIADAIRQRKGAR